MLTHCNRIKDPTATVIVSHTLRVHSRQRFDLKGGGILDEAQQVIGRRIIAELFLEKHKHNLHLYSQELTQKVWRNLNKALLDLLLCTHTSPRLAGRVIGEEGERSGQFSGAPSASRV